MFTGRGPIGLVLAVVGVIAGLSVWWAFARTPSFGAGASRIQELAWIDRTGRVTARVPDSAASYDGVWLARDERSAVVAIRGAGDSRLLWQIDLTTGEPGKLPDLPLAETTAERRLTHWSPVRLVFDVQGPDDQPDIWTAPTEAPGQATIYVQTAWPARQGQLSAEGRWLAYVSEESGRPEVYVQTFPDATAGRWLISLPDGGTHPVWRADSLMIYYRAPGGRIVAVPLKRGNRFVQPGNPEVWVTTPWGASSPFAVTRDGERILVAVPLEASDGQRDGP